MAELCDVKRWAMGYGNIGHMVRRCGINGIFTLCGAWFLGSCDYRELPTKTPSRICRKCRKALKTAKVVDEVSGK